jgi:hypothetical protein
MVFAGCGTPIMLLAQLLIHSTNVKDLASTDLVIRRT